MLLFALSHKLPSCSMQVSIVLTWCVCRSVRVRVRCTPQNQWRATTVIFYSTVRRFIYLPDHTLPKVAPRFFSERELMFTFAICRRPSVCLSVCLSSVTFVHPTQAIKIFCNVSTTFGTLAICDLSIKILRRSSQGNPSGEGLNQRGAAKYSDFRTSQGYISETVQYRR